MAKRRKSDPPPRAETGLFAQAADMRPRIGRPRFQPTDADRRYVRRMAAVGLSFEDIATTIGIDRGTLTLHFRADLDYGRIESNAAVGAALYRKATDKAVTGASVRAAEIWLRSRAGWVDAQHPKDDDDEAKDDEIVIKGGLPEPVDDPVVDAPGARKPATQALG